MNNVQIYKDNTLKLSLAMAFCDLNLKVTIGSFTSFKQALEDAFPGEATDLFYSPTRCTTKLKQICHKYFAILNNQECDSFEICTEFQSAVQAIGYTFDFDLDCEPVMLRKLTGPNFNDGVSE